MADFATTITTKTVVRKLANPVPDVTAFDNIVQGVINNNSFQCVGYNAGGVDHLPVERCRQSFTARIPYEDSEAKNVALVTIKAGTIAIFTAQANRVVADAGIATSFGGTANRDYEGETYAAALKCHDANGEIYFVNFTRDRVTLASYNDEAIRSRVETWADTVSSLA